MSDYSSTSREIILTKNQYLHMRDEKGNVSVVVGPNTVNLSTNQVVVVWDNEDGDYRTVTNNQQEGISTLVSARRDQYVVLYNPANSNEKQHPQHREQSPETDLQMGVVQIIPGPVEFALWPRQYAEVIEVHPLREIDYIVVRVTDPELAATNWQETYPNITPPWATEGASQQVTTPEDDAEQKPPATIVDMPETREYIITGLDQTTFVPVTGMVVVENPLINRINNDKYVREAVVPGPDDWCIVRSADGEERIERGPGAIFPQNPYESFVEIDEEIVFGPIVLTENSGLVIYSRENFTDTNGIEWEAGKMTFITGKDVRYFVPDARLVVITYGDGSPIRFGKTIPAGEAIYVLDKLEQEINLIEGQTIYLQNPEREAVVVRTLSEEQARLYYPDNVAAQLVHERRRQGQTETHDDFGSSTDIQEGLDALKLLVREGQHFSPPRQVRLGLNNTGAITIDIPSGVAVYVRGGDPSDDGVIVGPARRHLAYDEELVPFVVSTGTPKNPANTSKHAFRQLHSNRITDIVSVMTSDRFRFTVNLTYLVDFDLEKSELWWNAHNYVQIVVDRMFDIISGVARGVDHAEFHANAMSIVRSAILLEGNPYSFDSYGFMVTSVYVQSAEIEDIELRRLFESKQRSIAQRNAELGDATARATYEKAMEVLRIEIATAKAEADKAEHDFAIADTGRKRELAKATAEAETERHEAAQALLDVIAEAKRQRDAANAETELTINTANAQLQQSVLEAETKAVVDRYGAIAPEQFATLKRLADEHLLAELSEKFSGSAQLAGVPLMEYVQALLQGTGLEQFGNLLRMPQIDSNSSDE